MSDSTTNNDKVSVGKMRMLTGPDNFMTWSKLFKRYLRSKKLHPYLEENWRKLKGVSATTTYDELDESTLDDLETVLFLMASCISNEHQHYIDNTQYPDEAFKNLQTAFQSGGVTGEFRVFKRLENLVIDSDSSDTAYSTLQTFLADRSKIMSEAGAIGLNFIDLSKEQLIRFEIMRLLNKLPDSLYSVFIDMTTKNMNTYTSVTEVIEELRTWAETCFAIKSVPSQALSVTINKNGGDRRNKKCSRCKKNGHEEADCFHDPKNAHR